MEDNPLHVYSKKYVLLLYVLLQEMDLIISTALPNISTIITMGICGGGLGGVFKRAPGDQIVGSLAAGFVAGSASISFRVEAYSLIHTC